MLAGWIYRRGGVCKKERKKGGGIVIAILRGALGKGGGGGGGPYSPICRQKVPPFFRGRSEGRSIKMRDKGVLFMTMEMWGGRALIRGEEEEEAEGIIWIGAKLGSIRGG